MAHARTPKGPALFKGTAWDNTLDDLIGTCDVFKVVNVIPSGAFLYCGRAKDIFVPVGEQYKIMKQGYSYLVYVYLDEKRGRVAASSRLNKYLKDEAAPGMSEGDRVDLIIYSQTEMGYKAVVGKDRWGLLFQNEVFQDLRVGQKLNGYIKKIRPDGRIDLSLHKVGFESVLDLTQVILNHLKTHDGFCPFTDKTSPAEINRLFGVSKKKFKAAVGSLYKQRKLTIEPTGIRLVA